MARIILLICFCLMSTSFTIRLKKDKVKKKLKTIKAHTHEEAKNQHTSDAASESLGEDKLKSSKAHKRGEAKSEHSSGAWSEFLDEAGRTNCLCDKPTLEAWVANAELREQAQSFGSFVGGVILFLSEDRDWLASAIDRIPAEGAEEEGARASLQWLGHKFQGTAISVATNIAIQTFVPVLLGDGVALGAAGSGSTYSTMALLAPFEIAFAPWLIANLAGIRGQREIENAFQDQLRKPSTCGLAYSRMVMNLAQSMLSGFTDQHVAYADIAGFFEATGSCRWRPTDQHRNPFRDPWYWNETGSLHDEPNIWSQVLSTMKESFRNQYTGCEQGVCSSSNTPNPGPLLRAGDSVCNWERPCIDLRTYCPDRCGEAWTTAMWASGYKDYFNDGFGSANMHVFTKMRSVCDTGEYDGDDIQRMMTRFVQMFTCQWASWRYSQLERNDDDIERLAAFIDSPDFLERVRPEAQRLNVLQGSGEDDAFTTKNILKLVNAMGNPFHTAA